MITQEKTIIQYIPQRPPMVMVDKLIDCLTDEIQTGLTISSDNIFVENGVFTPPGLIENIAQTVAAGAGRRAAAENKPTPMGFLAGIKKLKIHKLPTVGSDIITHVRVINQIMSVGVIFGEIFQGNEPIAECEMRVFVQS